MCKASWMGWHVIIVFELIARGLEDLGWEQCRTKIRGGIGRYG